MTAYELEGRAIWQDWMQQDLKPLTEAVKTAVITHMSQFRAAFPQLKPYGYALYSCGGLPHFYPVMNTIERAIDEYDKFCPDEWHLHEDNNACIAPANAILDQLHQTFERCQREFDDYYQESDDPINQDVLQFWQTHIEKLFNAMLQALQELDKAGEFDWLEQQNKLVLIWFSDASEWELALSTSAVKALAGSELAQQFYHCLQ
ncbi:hypothetical protein NFHSH190041_34230 [Shewanella sp. NFH-SH190041]|uniref:DUF4303 domain-containing protein n=1 Tax=Shewanella sp. NFH-SH190041 TaxID=2950245 RepID=UPI0021C3D65B|nr:DUF4303 domain-containing protein [Shewanella sp. NFH-SH190041]BDM65971.1 hypothetical protein NFHSH190041_34230 [Shewanella sp. NFH-SH190041]